MDFSPCLQAARDTSLITVGGRVNQVIAMVLESLGPGIPVGSICEVLVFKGREKVLAEVGINPDRFSIEWASAAEAPRFVKLITEFTIKMKELGLPSGNKLQLKDIVSLNFLSL